MTKWVSLFSGIDGFRQAFDKIGFENVMSSDIDKHVNKAHEVLYGAPTAGDVTQIPSDALPEHDLLTAGFPCPTYSVAGNRDGMDYNCSDCGHKFVITYEQYKNTATCASCESINVEPADIRGLLFFEVARLSEAKQPKIVLMENVKGLVNHAKGESLRVILETMSDIGYRVDFEVLNSKYFNLPQNRERVFIVAVREDLVDFDHWDIKNNLMVGKAKRKYSEMNTVNTFNFSFPSNNEVTTVLRDILEDNVDEKFYLDEAKTAGLVSQLTAEGIAVREATQAGFKLAEEGDAVNISFPNSTTRRGRVGKGIAQTLEASDINQGVVVRGMLNMKGNECIRRVYDTDGVAPTLTTMGGGHREPKIAEVRAVLTPDRAEKQQNGRRFKDNDEPAFTLTAQDKHGVAVGEYPEYRIRKLTPTECFRLQGFDDSVVEKLIEAGISNTQLYKMSGNAVSVNVISALAEKLYKYLEVK